MTGQGTSPAARHQSTSQHRFPALTHGRLAATPGVADFSNVPAWCMTRRAVRRPLLEVPVSDTRRTWSCTVFGNRLGWGDCG